MTENKSHRKPEKKQKGHCYFGQWHASSASFLENKSRHEDGGGADRLIQNAILEKNVDGAIFTRSRALSKEDIDFCLFMALVFHDFPRQKSDKLVSLLGAILK